MNPVQPPQIPKIAGYKAKTSPIYTPDQMRLFSSLFSQVGPESFLQRLAGGDESAFEQSEAPALRQFQALQGQIGSRFAGMGRGGIKSSGFKNYMGQAGNEFAQDLQGKRQDMQRQALMDLMNISQQLLGNKPYESFYTPKKQGFLDSLLGSSSSGLGNLVTSGISKFFGF